MSGRELTAEMVAAGKSPRNNRFEIADDSGHVVLITAFWEAIDGS